MRLQVSGAGSAQIERRPLEVMLVLDRSGSMGEDGGAPLAALKTAAKLLVDQLDPTLDRVGLTSYSTTATLNNALTSDFASVKTAIDRLTASGYTNIVKQGDALPLPPGHLPVHRDMLIQRGDFVRRDHAWIGTTPDEWGTSVGTRLVVRPQPHGGAGC